MIIMHGVEWSEWHDHELGPIFTTRRSANAAFKRLEELDPSRGCRTIVEVEVYESVAEWLASGWAPASISTWREE